MRFAETAIAGVFVVELEPHADERGFFARAFCAREFEEHGLVPDLLQWNLALNHYAGTTRGLHYQAAFAPEAKFFRCVAGETFNIAVDAREGSPTFGRWVGVRLSRENRKALYIPPVCAAGYQALTDGAEVLYGASCPYTPEAERGMRLDDPTIGIEWPLEPSIVSGKDRAWPLLEPRGAV
jgi:dTDP-4-dehydrorhamnose 3,5-epimerase